jgi:ribosomal protein L23
MSCFEDLQKFTIKYNVEEMFEVDVQTKVVNFDLLIIFV